LRGAGQILEKNPNKLQYQLAFYLEKNFLRHKVIFPLFPPFFLCKRKILKNKFFLQLGEFALDSKTADREDSHTE